MLDRTLSLFNAQLTLVDETLNTADIQDQNYKRALDL